MNTKLLSIKVIGAGVGRTGTYSLKLALEQLLGGRCYHGGYELFNRPQDAVFWLKALSGDDVDWPSLLSKYTAIVDWPGAVFWDELSQAYPDALVILSVRDTDSWWISFNNTIPKALKESADFSHSSIPSDLVTSILWERFGRDIFSETKMKAAYEMHLQKVRHTIPKNRLLEWRVQDGWEPICKFLGLATPDLPFPFTNTTDDYLEYLKLIKKATKYNAITNK